MRSSARVVHDRHTTCMERVLAEQLDTATSNSKVQRLLAILTAEACSNMSGRFNTVITDATTLAQKGKTKWAQLVAS